MQWVVGQPQAQGLRTLRLLIAHGPLVADRCRHRCWRDKPGTGGVDPAAAIDRPTLTRAWRCGRRWESSARRMDARLQGCCAREQTSTGCVDPGLRGSGPCTTLRTGTG
jgi:hypothetical protein